MPFEYYDMEIDSVGFVDRGDNRTADGKAGAPVLIIKRAEPAQKRERIMPAENTAEAKKAKLEKRKAALQKALEGLEKAEGEGGDGGGGSFDPKALFKQLLEEEMIDLDQYEKLVEMLTKATGGTPEPAPMPTEAELMKRAETDPVFKRLLDEKRSAQVIAKRVEELEKREREANARAERSELEKVFAPLTLPETSVEVAKVLHDVRLAVRSAEGSVIEKAATGKPNAAERVERIIKAMAAMIDKSALFGERGRRTVREQPTLDPSDKTIPAGDRIEALTKQAIEKSAKDAGADKDKILSYAQAMDLVVEQHPELADEYLTNG